jgi:hypothetical protein
MRGLIRNQPCAGCWWLTPVILVTQKAEIKRITIQSQPEYLKKTHHQKGLVEWLKV